MEPQKWEWQIVECKLNAGDWRVEGIGSPEGLCSVVIFTGANARGWAEEYFNFKTTTNE